MHRNSNLQHQSLTVGNLSRNLPNQPQPQPVIPHCTLRQLSRLGCSKMILSFLEGFNGIRIWHVFRMSSSYENLKALLKYFKSAFNRRCQDILKAKWSSEHQFLSGFPTSETVRPETFDEKILKFIQTYHEGFWCTFRGSKGPQGKGNSEFTVPSRKSHRLRRSQHGSQERNRSSRLYNVNAVQQ